MCITAISRSVGWSDGRSRGGRIMMPVLTRLRLLATSLARAVIADPQRLYYARRTVPETKLVLAVVRIPGPRAARRAAMSRSIRHIYMCINRRVCGRRARRSGATVAAAAVSVIWRRTIIVTVIIIATDRRVARSY